MPLETVFWVLLLNETYSLLNDVAVMEAAEYQMTGNAYSLEKVPDRVEWLETCRWKKTEVVDLVFLSQKKKLLAA